MDTTTDVPATAAAVAAASSGIAEHKAAEKAASVGATDIKTDSLEAVTEHATLESFVAAVRNDAAAQLAVAEAFRPFAHVTVPLPCVYLARDPDRGGDGADLRVCPCECDVNYPALVLAMRQRGWHVRAVQGTAAVTITEVHVWLEPAQYSSAMRDWPTPCDDQERDDYARALNVVAKRATWLAAQTRLFLALVPSLCKPSAASREPERTVCLHVVLRRSCGVPIDERPLREELDGLRLVKMSGRMFHDAMPWYADAPLQPSSTLSVKKNDTEFKSSGTLGTFVLPLNALPGSLPLALTAAHVISAGEWGGDYPQLSTGLNADEIWQHQQPRDVFHSVERQRDGITTLEPTVIGSATMSLDACRNAVDAAVVTVSEDWLPASTGELPARLFGVVKAADTGGYFDPAWQRSGLTIQGSKAAGINLDGTVYDPALATSLLGTDVCKYGAATELTFGTVVAVGLAHLTDPTQWTAALSDKKVSCGKLGVKALVAGHNFSRPGDSGALVVTRPPPGSAVVGAVGLHYGRLEYNSWLLGMSSPMEHVLATLNVELCQAPVDKAPTAAPS